MKPILINGTAKILRGELAGFTGRVVGANSFDNEVTLVIDNCYVSTERDNVEQVEGEG